MADADGKASGSARKSKGGAGGYEMAPELRKVVDAMRAAVSELPPPPEDDKKQGLPQVIKDLLPALAGHLTRCASHDMPRAVCRGCADRCHVTLNNGAAHLEKCASLLSSQHTLHRQ